MSIQTNVVRNAQTVEYGKFVELENTQFPAVSVIRIQQWDESAAFPNNTNRPLLTSVDVYPKYAVLTYQVGQGSGFTRCESRTSGTPSFISSKIFIHNSVNNNTVVRLTLTSGLSCSIPIGKSSEANHIYEEMLAVTNVIDYGGCQINFYA